jgi:hypothetical protein
VSARSGTCAEARAGTRSSRAASVHASRVRTMTISSLNRRSIDDGCQFHAGTELAGSRDANDATCDRPAEVGCRGSETPPYDFRSRRSEFVGVLAVTTAPNRAGLAGVARPNAPPFDFAQGVLSLPKDDSRTSRIWTPPVRQASGSSCGPSKKRCSRISGLSRGACGSGPRWSVATSGANRLTAASRRPRHASSRPNLMRRRLRGPSR